MFLHSNVEGNAINMVNIKLYPKDVEAQNSSATFNLFNISKI